MTTNNIADKKWLCLLAPYQILSKVVCNQIMELQDLVWGRPWYYNKVQMNLQNKNSRTKIFKFHNLIADYSTKDLERDKQSGFIPMLIMIVIVIAIFIWLVYSRVSSYH